MLLVCRADEAELAAHRKILDGIQKESNDLCPWIGDR
jgi:hypothetical protein